MAIILTLVIVSTATLGVLFLYSLGLDALSHESRLSLVTFTDTAQASAAQPVPEVTIIFVGDIMLGRDVESTSKLRGGYDYPFAETKELIQSADIAVGNLETPLTPGEAVPTEAMVFRADTEWAQALADAGFDVVTLANNHIPNQGSGGIQDTIQSLDSAGVLHTGAGMNRAAAETAALVAVSDVTFAFLGYNDADVVPDGYFAADTRAGTAPMHHDRMREAVLHAQDHADFIVVMMHSGTEYTEQPNHRQIDFAQAAIDAGADLVIGHHPHVIQTSEEYKGKYIYYSLGNFVFDQMWSEPTRRGMVLTVTIRDNEVTDVREDRVRIYDFAQPRIEL